VQNSNVSYYGQSGIFDPAKFTWPVHIIGMGGIGSALFLPLIKLGVKTIHIWDRDDVEPHNIPCQLIYRTNDIGQSKVQVAFDFAQFMGAECEVTPHDELVTADTTLDGVIISGVDSMTSRQVIWQAIKSNVAKVPFYMDGRIGGEQLELHCLRPIRYDESQDYADNWLFDDSEALDLPCAARTVIHPAIVLSGQIIAQLTRFYRGLAFDKHVLWHLKNNQNVMEGGE
jgi:hypothetical protein